MELLRELKNRDPEVQAKYDIATNDQQFMDYLNSTRVLGAINLRLQELYLEDPRPKNATNFMHKQLWRFYKAPHNPLVELQEARAKIEKLQKENAELREQLMSNIRAKKPLQLPKKRPRFCKAPPDPFVKLQEATAKMEMLQNEEGKLREKLMAYIRAKRPLRVPKKKL